MIYKNLLKRYAEYVDMKKIRINRLFLFQVYAVYKEKKKKTYSTNSTRNKKEILSKWFQAGNAEKIRHIPIILAEN